MRKYLLNQNFFKTWSHDMSYILGLWWADGHICKIGRKYIFGITLHKNDKYLLCNILEKMGTSIQPYLNKNIYHISISSKTIVNDIINLGGDFRKSLSIGFPDIPKEYLPDFIRGFFDGDGSIFKLKYRSGYSSDFVSASIKFITGLKIAMVNNIPDFKCSFVEKTLENAIRYHKDSSNIIPKNPSYILKLSSNNTRRLRDFMYIAEDELRLKRKYEKHIKNGEVRLSNSDKVFKTYENILSFSKSLGLKTSREWHSYFHINKNNINGIPDHPDIIYKESGWTNWYDFLGKEKSRK